MSSEAILSLVTCAAALFDIVTSPSTLVCYPHPLVCIPCALAMNPDINFLLADPDVIIIILCVRS